ncbi:hypothetical protein HYX10_00775 [Candidatus Woesearchaeota archaeon]|nr:hypothetical protein [Candidatus Woesearchaeota archaeon]
MAENGISRVLNVVSVTILIIGGLTAINKPQATIVAAISTVFLMVIIYAIEKFNKIKENESKITALNERLNLETRFCNMEKEIAEQKGRLAGLKK